MIYNGYCDSDRWDFSYCVAVVIPSDVIEPHSYVYSVRSPRGNAPDTHGWIQVTNQGQDSWEPSIETFFKLLKFTLYLFVIIKLTLFHILCHHLTVIVNVSKVAIHHKLKKYDVEKTVKECRFWFGGKSWKKLHHYDIQKVDCPRMCHWNIKVNLTKCPRYISRVLTIWTCLR